MPLIPQTKIDEIQAAGDIVSTVSRYVSLKKAGKNFKGLCPFHKEKTPSFIVSPEKQIYHCFGCGKGGNVFNFIMAMENISYVEAIRRMAGDLGIPIPERYSEQNKHKSSEYENLYLANKITNEYFCKPFPANVRKYLDNRKLKEETIKTFSIGFAPNKWDGLINTANFKTVKNDFYEELGLIQKKDGSNRYFDRFRNRLMFPFINISGQIVGFGGRRLNESDQPKYLNSPESRVYKKGELLYGLHQAINSIREKKSVILVEGYFDLLRLVDHGIRNVVASSGTAVSESQGRLIKRYTDSVIIAYDSDDAGIQAALRNSIILESLDLNVMMIIIPKPDDPDSFILEKGYKPFIELLKSRVSPIDYQLSILHQKGEDLALQDKNKLIDGILEDYLHIPNDVRIGLYIHKISQKFEIAESFLISRFNNLKKRDKFRLKDKNEETNKGKIDFRKGQWRAEEDLISILLGDDKDVIKYIFDHVSISDFVNEDLRNFFDILGHQWEDMGHFDIKFLENSITDEKQMNLLTKLSFQVINRPLKYASGCIYRMRKWHLDSRYNEIMRLMKEEATSDKSKLHYTKELTTIRQQLSEIEIEHNKFLKTDL